MPYNCTKKSDGCFDRTNLTLCGTGYQCVSGACQVIPSCDDNSDCVSFTNTCSVGICNSTGKCEIVYNSTGSLCREAVAGGCDVAEYCSGSNAACPADGFQPSSYTCRAEANGGCDVAELCSGTSAVCPSDALRSNSYTCRASAGECDIAERCSGTSVTCPTNVFNLSTTTCRVSAGECDSSEKCTGNSAACPDNAFNASGTPCSVGVCDDGVCVGQCTDTCNSLGYECGSWTICGTLTNCGTCGTGENCENGKCVADPCYGASCSDYLTQSTCENNVCLACDWISGTCQPASTPTINQITQFGITWTFDKPYPYGQFANGDYWVVGPVKIIGITPVSRDDGTGRIVHGSMLNPSPRSGYQQGYDSRMYGGYDQGFYIPSLNVARPNNQQLSASNPLTIQTGSLVSAISAPNPSGSTQLQTAAILTVLSSPAPQGSFRPSYSGSDKTIKFNKNQLNYSPLKRLAPVTNTPRLKQQAGDAQADSVERMFERPWLNHIPLSSGLGRSHHPLENMPDYGGHAIGMAGQVGTGALMLNLDYTNQEKETLLIRLVQLGIDNYGVIQDGGRENWQGAGGQTPGNKLPILLAGLILNDNNMKNIGQKSGDYLYSGSYGPGNEPPDYIYFGEDDQTFYVAQLDVDLTHSAAWNPDSRDTQRIPYNTADIGLPEWGIIHANGPERSNKYWGTAYRVVAGPSFHGMVLAAHIMGIKDLWNHDSLFDYTDRYTEIETGWTPVPFVVNMWNTYRDDYGCVWKRNNPNDIYSQGSNGCVNVAKPSKVGLLDKIIDWFEGLFQ